MDSNQSNSKEETNSQLPTSLQSTRYFNDNTLLGQIFGVSQLFYQKWILIQEHLITFTLQSVYTRHRHLIFWPQKLNQFSKSSRGTKRPHWSRWR